MPGEEKRLDRAASCGEPSYVWRAGQDRRLEMIRAALPGLGTASVLEIGCGVGRYIENLAGLAPVGVGFEYKPEHPRFPAGRAPRVGTHSNQASPLASESL